jgi:hypothetical protein
VVRCEGGQELPSACGARMFMTVYVRQPSEPIAGSVVPVLN